MGKFGKHIAIVEPYEGLIEFLSDEPEERRLARGLGLPLEEIAEGLDCRITILCWNLWYKHELKETWVPTPATRVVREPHFGNIVRTFKSDRIKMLNIIPRDPVTMKNVAHRGLSPRSYGLINDGGLLSFISYCLNIELKEFYERDHCDCIILPMWGGIGYVTQLSRATNVQDFIDVPHVVVVTDISSNRQISNQEGYWTREAIIRRQMEDVSLALADSVIYFGPKGEKIALRGRLPESQFPIHAPRFVDPVILKEIEQASKLRYEIKNMPIQFFMHEPQEPAYGVLSALDALIDMNSNGLRLDMPFISSGVSKVFAPMKPLSFEEYWRSRGSVRELASENKWKWESKYPKINNAFPIRLYPSFFDHLPNIWSELAKGSLVVLSQTAAEGLAPNEIQFREILIKGEPNPKNLEEAILRVRSTNLEKLDRIRQELCSRVVAAHRGEVRSRLLNNTIDSIEKLIYTRSKPQDLSKISLMFLDRRLSLRDSAKNDGKQVTSLATAANNQGKLSVVITCYEMGNMIEGAVESVWKSERLPDEVILINDGSKGEKTLEYIQRLEKKANQKNLPLSVIHQRNQGLASARNTGLEAASGEFISFLDGDDLIEPQFYRLALDILKQNPRLGGVAAWAHIFGTGSPDGFWNAPQAELPFLFIQNSIIVPCVTRTKLLRELGGYDLRQRYNYEDWELGIRMLLNGWPIITIPMHLTRYRLRQDSLFRTMTHIQNQVMRERLMYKHKESVSTFGVEIAMQLEDQLMRYMYPDRRAPERSDYSIFKPLNQFLLKTKHIFSRLT